MKFIEYLEYIKRRPGMYMANNTQLHDLELQFWGYETALRNHGVTEDISGFNTGFREYIFETRKWSTSRGWADAIITNSKSSELAVETFFELADEYLNKNHGIRLS